MNFVNTTHVCKQVVLKFPFPFWQKKVGDADFFGRVAKTKEDRGLFPMFYDMVYTVGLYLVYVVSLCTIGKGETPKISWGIPRH